MAWHYKREKELRAPGKGGGGGGEEGRGREDCKEDGNVIINSRAKGEQRDDEPKVEKIEKEEEEVEEVEETIRMGDALFENLSSSSSSSSEDEDEDEEEDEE